MIEAEDSFSFFNFRGPVSGKVQEIQVKNSFGPNNAENRVDYMAKPDYYFHYGVQDTKTGNSQGHKEVRNGDSVEGEYRVLQDDGLIRIVRYTADPEKGFMAYVHYAELNSRNEDPNDEEIKDQMQ
ncbi:cuticle protein 8 [Dendroctonus ponderosae]